MLTSYQTGMILIVSVKVHNLSQWYRHDNIQDFS